MQGNFKYKITMKLLNCEDLWPHILKINTLKYLCLFSVRRKQKLFSLKMTKMYKIVHDNTWK